MNHNLWVIIYDGLRELPTERNPDIQSSETLFAWIQECGWNKESYQPQFNQYWTTIHHDGNDWTTLNHQNLNFAKIKSFLVYLNFLMIEVSINIQKVVNLSFVDTL